MAWCSPPSKKSLSFQCRCCRVCLRPPKQGNMAWKTITHRCRQQYVSCPKCCSLYCPLWNCILLLQWPKMQALGCQRCYVGSSNLFCHPCHAVAAITSRYSRSQQELLAEGHVLQLRCSCFIQAISVATSTQETLLRFKLNPLFRCLHSLVQFDPNLCRGKSWYFKVLTW